MSLMVTLRALLAGWANPILLPADRPFRRRTSLSSYVLDRFSVARVAERATGRSRSATGNRVRTRPSGLGGAALDRDKPLRRQPREAAVDKPLDEGDGAQVHLRSGDFNLPVCLLLCDDAPLFGEMAPGLRSSFAGPAFSGYERVGTTFVASGPFGPST
jgi:hypothetical protein